MTKVADYLNKISVKGRASFDQWFSLALELDQTRGCSFGVKVNPSTGDIRYTVRHFDGRGGQTVERVFQSFGRAYSAYIEESPRSLDGSKLIH